MKDDVYNCCHFWRPSCTLSWTSLLPLLLSFSANVLRSGSIAVLGDPIFANVSGFGVVVGEGEGLGGTHCTEARAPKWAKVIKLPRRDAHAATPSLNNNIIYRIYLGC